MTGWATDAHRWMRKQREIAAEIERGDILPRFSPDDYWTELSLRSQRQRVLAQLTKDGA